MRVGIFSCVAGGGGRGTQGDGEMSNVAALPLYKNIAVLNS